MYKSIIHATKDFNKCNYNMNYFTSKKTNAGSYSEYIDNVIKTVDASSAKNLKDNRMYLEDLNNLKNKASIYVNTINTANRFLNIKKTMMIKDKFNLYQKYYEDGIKLSKYLQLQIPAIVSHAEYITYLKNQFSAFQISETTKNNNTVVKINEDAIDNFKTYVNNTYTNLNNMLDIIYNFHITCKPYIKTYGICSGFYDNYLNTIATTFMQAVNIIQQYDIIQIENNPDTKNNVNNIVHDNELFLITTNEQTAFKVTQDALDQLSTKDTKTLTIDEQITKKLSNFINSLKSDRTSLTNKTILVLNEILSSNCDFVLTSSYSKFNDYTLNINIEYAIERNDIHNFECKNFLYTLFNNLKKIRDDVKKIKDSPYTGDLYKSLYTVFSDIYHRRSRYVINVTDYAQNIYIRLPYLINYCDLISLCNEISASNKHSFGDNLYEIFSNLSKINITPKQGEQQKSDNIYDTMLTSIISNYILNFNMIAFHEKSSDVLKPDDINAVSLSTILYNVTSSNVYVDDVDMCSMTKKPTDISKGSGKTMLSLVICYAVFIVAIAFNVVMFIFKEKIKAKFNDPTKTKIINNIFYWINLGCIIAAGVSSFLRITDVYSTSFFTRLGVIVTVNVITMIFCSFSLYFIDPNTFWNTTAKTAKTEETKNTENNNSNANDNANANQQSSN